MSGSDTVNHAAAMLASQQANWEASHLSMTFRAAQLTSSVHTLQLARRRRPAFAQLCIMLAG